MGYYRAGLVRWAKALIPQTWRAYYSFIKNDPSRKEKIPLRWKIALWRKGFYANRYYYYDLKKNPSQYYLSDHFRSLTHPKNGRFSSLIDNKLYFPLCFKDFPEHVPEYYFLLRPDTVVKLFDDRAVLSKRDPDALNAVVDLIERRKCVGKPIWKSCGEEVLILENRSGDFFKNNQPCTRDELRSLFQSQSDYIITEFVAQHPYAARLNEGTTNTLRLMTCWDPETNTPFVAWAFQRMGRAGMYGADNSALGGLCSWIDAETGIAGHIPLVQDRQVRFVERHPDTGVQIHGFKIPHFEEITATLLKMCHALNFLCYIGWDIVVTKDSFKIVEVNSDPDVYGYQLYKPLLRDERLLRFYRQFVTKRTRKFFMR
jgi:hypothetical protein